MHFKHLSSTFHTLDNLHHHIHPRLRLLQLQSRTFTSTPIDSKAKDQIPPRPTLPDNEIKHVYLKGSGPGGQKINKTSSAVQLTHLPTGLVVKSQATRSRSQNHTIARRILAEKIELIQKGSESRVAKKIERAQRKKKSADKKKRRKYRKLEDGKEGDTAILSGGTIGPSETVDDEELEEEEEDDEEDDDLATNNQENSTHDESTPPTDNQSEQLTGPDWTHDETWTAYVQRKGPDAYKNLTAFIPDETALGPDGTVIKSDGTVLKAGDRTIQEIIERANDVEYQRPKDQIDTQADGR